MRRELGDEFGESMTTLRLLVRVLILPGVVGPNLGGVHRLRLGSIRRTS